MAPISLATMFSTARDRLILLCNAAVTNSVSALPYIVPQTTAYPHTDFFIQGVNRSLIATAQQRWTVNLRVVIHVAQFTQGYDGQAQIDAQWVVLPTALQYFEQHSALKVNSTDAGLPWFDPINSAINTSTIQISSLGESYGGEINLILNWSLVLNTLFPRDC
jgi:hypothetical protein